jgi:hypothetical protein
MQEALSRALLCGVNVRPYLSVLALDSKIMPVCFLNAMTEIVL